MIETKERTIGGHVYSVTQLPAMRAWKLLPMATRWHDLSGDELERFTRELLSQARVDGHELMPVFDVTMAGKMHDVVELLGFAIQLNYENPCDAPANVDAEPTGAHSAA
jgi:hypothetical protein